MFALKWERDTMMCLKELHDDVLVRWRKENHFCLFICPRDDQTEKKTRRNLQFYNKWKVNTSHEDVIVVVDCWSKINFNFTLDWSTGLSWKWQTLDFFTVYTPSICCEWMKTPTEWKRSQISFNWNSTDDIQRCVIFSIKSRFSRSLTSPFINHNGNLKLRRCG